MSNKKPDIVFILCDQWNARYLGCAGHTQINTPHIDELASKGCIFDMAYTPSPVCMPARVSLASGLYPHSHGFLNNYTEKLFPVSQVTLFHCLQDTGYKTAKIGKYHYFHLEWGQDYEDYKDYYKQLGLDWTEETSTPFQGPFLNTGYSRMLKEHGLLEKFITDIGDRYVDGQYTARPSLLPPDMTPDGYVCRQALAYLKLSSTSKPLFICISFPGPHTPLDSPGDYCRMYDPNKVELPENYIEGQCNYGRKELKKMTTQYMGKITHLDDRVGEIIRALKKRGNWDNTIIVFSADHGDRMGEHGLVSKGGFEEGSARVPLIISGPAAPIKKNGFRNNSPVSLLDLFPTFIQIADGKVPDYCQSISLLPILRGEANELQEAVFSEIAENATNGGNLKYMVRDLRWKWHIKNKSGQQYLFDMKADPYEMNNLAGSSSHDEILRNQRERLLNFLMSKQLNHARGYKPLFSRIGLKFDIDDPEERKNSIYKSLKMVHE